MLIKKQFKRIEKENFRKRSDDDLKQLLKRYDNT